MTGVGINTEWGLMMGTTSRDTGEETPLQVFFLFFFFVVVKPCFMSAILFAKGHE